MVPARYGGLDAGGRWDPAANTPATDAGQKAAAPFAGRRYVVRVAPGLLEGQVSEEALADALSRRASDHWADVCASLDDLDLPEDVRESIAALNDAKPWKRSRRHAGGREPAVTVHLGLYGENDAGPRGVVFLARFGLEPEKAQETGDESDAPASTEDDVADSMPGFGLSLARHSEEVAAMAALFAEKADLPPALVKDVRLAGLLHDAGKADRRFQAWLHHGDPLGPDPDDPGEALAKSGRPLPRRAREESGLPDRWRHEALSVRLAMANRRLAEAHDPELVLWLVGVHHGHGRPFFPHGDPEDAERRSFPDLIGLPRELPPGRGPQSLAFDHGGLDWPSLFARLAARYGVWELARLEAILRLADHRASEEAARREMPE